MNASRDNNFVPGSLGVLYTDPTVTIPIAISESNGGMKINIIDTVQFTMTPIDIEDTNFVNCMTFEGSDGLVYPWVVDADGAVLIDM